MQTLHDVHVAKLVSLTFAIYALILFQKMYAEKTEIDALFLILDMETN